MEIMYRRWNPYWDYYRKPSKRRKITTILAGIDNDIVSNPT